MPSYKSAKSYISFVTAARNDDFGGDFLARFQNSLASLLTWSKKYHLNAEIIVVEWNPPSDRPRLKDNTILPKDIKPATLRFIEVPPEIHQKFSNSQKIPFFEFFAKNAGIRRAQGEYILVTNSDIIWSEEIIKYFAAKPFSKNIFGRADRYDVKGPAPRNLTPEEIIAYCKSNTLIINTMHGAMFNSREEWFRQKILNRIKGITLKKIINKIRKGSGPAPQTRNADQEPEWDYRGLYIHNGGDFMLMHKNQWQKLRGYPEIGIDRGLDCYMTIMAHIAGLLQVVVPYPIYHIEHSRAQQLSRPTAVLENIPEFNQMIAAEKPVVINDENWGMAKLKLEEVVIIK